MKRRAPQIRVMVVVAMQKFKCLVTAFGVARLRPGAADLLLDLAEARFLRTAPVRTDLEIAAKGSFPVSALRATSASHPLPLTGRCSPLVDAIAFSAQE